MVNQLGMCVRTKSLHKVRTLKLVRSYVKALHLQVQTWISKHTYVPELHPPHSSCLQTSLPSAVRDGSG